MEKDLHHAGEPLYLHFARQRRRWWQVAWWLPVVAAVLMLVPLLNAVLFAFYQSAYSLYVPAWLQVTGILSGRVAIPVAMAIVLLTLHELTRDYRVPGELLVASSAADINRALQRIMRLDCWLLFGPLLTLPLIVITGIDGLFPPLVLYTGMFPWMNMAAAAVYLTGLSLAVCETVILLRLRAFRMSRFMHILLPMLLALAVLILGPTTDEAAFYIFNQRLVFMKAPYPGAAIIAGVVLAAIGIWLNRINRLAELKTDHWREL